MMSGNSLYTPRIWPYFFTVIFSLALAVYGRRFRIRPAMPSFDTGWLFAAS